MNYCMNDQTIKQQFVTFSDQIDQHYVKKFILEICPKIRDSGQACISRSFGY